MEGKKLDIHNHILPKNWPDLKERFLRVFFTKNCHIDCLVAGMDMGAGSVLTTPVEAAQGLGKPI